MGVFSTQSDLCFSLDGSVIILDPSNHQTQIITIHIIQLDLSEFHVPTKMGKSSISRRGTVRERPKHQANMQQAARRERAGRTGKKEPKCMNCCSQPVGDPSCSQARSLGNSLPFRAFAYVCMYKAQKATLFTCEMRSLGSPARVTGGRQGIYHVCLLLVGCSGSWLYHTLHMYFYRWQASVRVRRRRGIFTLAPFHPLIFLLRDSHTRSLIKSF